LKPLLTVAFLFISIFFALGQWTEIAVIEKKCDKIVIDNLQNTYAISGAEIYKYTRNGSFQFRYSDLKLGAVDALDVSFPLRPLVIYADLNSAALLDNTLTNNRGVIHLLDYEIGLGTLGCSSIQNHYWFYDAMRFSLTRLDDRFARTAYTGNLAQLLNIELRPTAMVEFANKCYLNNPGTGILVFDIFGTYIKTIPITGIADFQIFETQLAYFEDGKLKLYDTRTFITDVIDLPIGSLDAVIFDNRIAVRSATQIQILEITSR